jgi:hypothetical protein
MSVTPAISAPIGCGAEGARNVKDAAGEGWKELRHEVNHDRLSLRAKDHKAQDKLLSPRFEVRHTNVAQSPPDARGPSRNNDLQAWREGAIRPPNERSRLPCQT